MAPLDASAREAAAAAALSGASAITTASVSAERVIKTTRSCLPDSATAPVATVRRFDPSSFIRPLAPSASHETCNRYFGIGPPFSKEANVGRSLRRVARNGGPRTVVSCHVPISVVLVDDHPIVLQGLQFPFGTPAGLQGRLQLAPLPKARWTPCASIAPTSWCWILRDAARPRRLPIRAARSGRRRNWIAGASCSPPRSATTKSWKPRSLVSQAWC